MTAEELWKEYSQDNALENTKYEAWQFGDAPDELAKLVKRGIKTATCSLYFWYKSEGEVLPAEGEYSVVLNAKDEAVCIIKTTKVTILPYCHVSEEQAYKEGEGDRSLAYWRRVHKDFFSKELASVQKAFAEDMEVVFEEFELVYAAGIVRTERLEIKPFLQNDMEELAELLLNEEIKKTYMIPDFANDEELDKMRNVFMELSHSDSHFTRGIYTDNRLIGFVNDVAIEKESIELGYVIHPAFAGKGYATEMLREVMKELLGKRFSVIKTGAFCENTASIRVMEKCNMRRCRETENIVYRGVEHTCIYYEISNRRGSIK